MFDHDRRFGIVHLAAVLAEKEPDVVANVVFRDCVIIRAEYEPISRTINYVFYSPDIPAIPHGACAPIYMAQAHKQMDADGTRVVSYTRTWVTSQGHGQQSKRA